MLEDDPLGPWAQQFISSVPPSERASLRDILGEAAQAVANKAGLPVAGVMDAFQYLKTANLFDVPSSPDWDRDTVSEESTRRKAWERLRRFVLQHQIEAGATVVDVVSAFYGEPLEGVKPHRFKLPREQWDRLAFLIREHYASWTPRALDLVRPLPSESVPYPILSRRPSVEWLGRQLPLTPTAGLFALYMPRFAFVDPLEALARDWYPSYADDKHRDSIMEPHYWPGLQDYIRQSLNLLQDLTPLVRAHEVTFLHQSLRMSERAQALFHQMAGPMYDQIPTNISPERLVNVMSWDYAAAELQLSGVAADREAWQTINAATDTLLLAHDNSLQARRVSVLRRTEVPQLSAAPLKDIVNLRNSVDSIVELRALVGSFTHEIETLLDSEGEVSTDLARDLANERVRPAAAAVKREVGRSNALESLVTGSVIVVGGLTEFMVTGKTDLASVVASGGAGLAPWLVWRAKSRLATDLRNRRVLRDFLLRLCAD
jgi:hypothetical protein